MIDKPTPGSDAAVAAGCRCPVMDNHHGKGNPLGQFWVNAECPLHGAHPVEKLVFREVKG